MIKKVVFFLILFCLSTQSADALKFKDDSSAIFLPPSMQQLAKATQNFSFFWKGLVLIDVSNKELALPYIEKLCEILKDEESVGEYYCKRNQFRQSQEQIKDWVRDLSLREAMPSSQDFQKTLQSQIALASLPGVPKELISTLRWDPFGASEKLWKIKEQFFRAPSEWMGYFANSSKNTIMIPFSFTHPPQQSQATETFKKKLEALCVGQACPASVVLGPHFAILVNQSRVFDDLTLIGVLAGVFFTLLMIFLGWKRGVALLSLCVPLVPALILALVATVTIFGSVHGLTLAFGPSLVGLALDYGLHTKIHKGSREAWSSNLFGLLTTLVGFLVLLFSDIPLIQQMMVFALVGLLLSFVFYYFLSQSKSLLWKSTEFEVFSFHMSPKKWEGPFVVVLLIASLFIWPFVKLDLNLKNFDFRQEHQSDLEKKWWSGTNTPTVLFSVVDDAEKTYEQKKWATHNALPLQSWSTYIPREAEQEINLSSWKNCRFEFPGIAKKFFEPFGALDPCQNQSKTFKSPQIPAYAIDFVSRDSGKRELLNVWFPKSDREAKFIEKKQKGVTSLRAIFENFPKILLREIWLMFPIGIGICFLLIFYHVRKVSYSLLALVPMFSAIGFTLLSFFLASKSLSFISCVALLMIFGSSVDYGIFQVDSLIRPASRKSASETFSSIFMQALVTIIGYLPMVFAKHPVLNDMGWVLTLGTVGGFLGGVWGVPYLIGKLPRVLKHERS